MGDSGMYYYWRAIERQPVNFGQTLMKFKLNEQVQKARSEKAFAYFDTALQQKLDSFDTFESSILRLK